MPTSGGVGPAGALRRHRRGRRLAAGVLFHWWLAPLIALGVGGYNLVHEVHLRRTTGPRVAARSPTCWSPSGCWPSASHPAAHHPARCSRRWPSLLRRGPPASQPLPRGGRHRRRHPRAAGGRLGWLVDGAAVAASGFAVSGLLITAGPRQPGRQRGRRCAAGSPDLVDDVDAVVWSRDPGTHRFTYVSGQASWLLGFSTDEWRAEGFWLSRLHPEDLDRVTGAVASPDVRGGLVPDASPPTAGGPRSTTGSPPSTDADGAVIALQGAHHRRDRAALDRAALPPVRRHRRAHRARPPGGPGRGGPDGDPPRRCSVANPAARELLGDTEGEVRGRRLSELIPALAPPEVAQPAGRGAAPRRAAPRSTTWHLGSRGRDDRRADVDAFRLPGGPARHLAAGHHRACPWPPEALRRQALHDALTGLPNRRPARRATSPRRAARPPPTGDRVALLMMDLDQFKEVNDALGHQVGDRLLRGSAGRLARRSSAPTPRPPRRRRVRRAADRRPRRDRRRRGAPPRS